MNTQTTTEKQNILIAEFMGVQLNSMTIEEFRKLDPTDKIFCNKAFSEDLDYNRNWSSLMSVVEKIELMNKETGFMGTFTLFGQGRTKVKCYIKENLKHEIDILSERYGIAPTYKAVVEFIQWYNTEKAKQVYPKSIGPINQNPEFYVNFFTDILETKCFNAVQTPEACKHLLNYAENKLIEANLNKA